MAKKNETPVVNAENENSVNGQEPVKLIDGKTPEQIQEDIKALQDKAKELKAQLKGEKVKSPRVLKGKMVTFKNKAGEQITGLGVLYYVTRAEGKLHYKEASQVTLLPEDWKAGDPIPQTEPSVEDELVG